MDETLGRLIAVVVLGGVATIILVLRDLIRNRIRRRRETRAVAGSSVSDERREQYLKRRRMDPYE